MFRYVMSYLGFREVFQGVEDLGFTELEFNKHQLVINLSDFLQKRFKDFNSSWVFFLEHGQHNHIAPYLLPVEVDKSKFDSLLEEDNILLFAPFD